MGNEQEQSIKAVFISDVHLPGRWNNELGPLDQLSLGLCFIISKYDSNYRPIDPKTLPAMRARGAALVTEALIKDPKLLPPMLEELKQFPDALFDIGSTLVDCSISGEIKLSPANILRTPMEIIGNYLQAYALSQLDKSMPPVEPSTLLLDLNEYAKKLNFNPTSK